MQTAPIVRAIVKRIPQVKGLLSPRARYIAALGGSHAWDAKTVDFMERTIRRYILMLYRDEIGFEFLDLMAGLIEAQFTRAYNQVLREEGVEMDAEFESHLTGMIVNQFPFVDGLFSDILQARVDGAPVEPLLSRASLWSNRYNEVVNEAIAEVARRFGLKKIWNLGATEEHCPSCTALAGIVAFAAEWDASGFMPQNAPNPLLSCEGWHCDCSLTITEQRRSPRAMETLMNIAVSGNL